MTRILVATSVGVSIGISIVLDVLLVTGSRTIPPEIAVSTLLFNLTVILFSAVGGAIEWRRPGHAIGRALMVSGPLYAFLGLIWLTGESLEAALGPASYQLLSDVSAILSWIGVAMIVGWIPLLFPTGTLPGPRWRLPTIGLATAFTGCLVLLAIASYMTVGADPTPDQDLLASVTFVGVLGWIGFAVAAVITRYRRGDQVERLQIRWFGASVALCAIGGAATALESVLRNDDGPLVATLILYAGILAIPITIGVAVTRYRLYELDRIISRTIAYAAITAIIGTIFVGGILGLQAMLADWTQGGTLAVAISTLAAFALFQPVRRRVQGAVDRRFNRGRVDAERVTAGFIAHLRDELVLDHLLAALVDTAGQAVEPRQAVVWLRRHDPTSP